MAEFFSFAENEKNRKASVIITEKITAEGTPEFSVQESNFNVDNLPTLNNFGHFLKRNWQISYEFT